MGKRIICVFLAVIIFIISCPAVYAGNFSDAYNAGVSSAILSKSSKEKIERELLRVLRLEVTEIKMEKIQTDCEAILSDRSIRNVIQSNIDVDPIAVLKESGSKEEYQNAIAEKIVALHGTSMAADITDSNLSAVYTEIMYVYNFTGLLSETDYTFNDDLLAVYSDINNIDSEFIKRKLELETRKANDLVIITPIIAGEEFEHTKSALAAESDTTELLFQKVSGGYYYTNEILIGQALSAAYKPLRTNVVRDINLYEIPGSERFKQFNFKYGDLRKAVYIATGDKAVSQYYITGQVNTYKVATLRDLIKNIEREKLLIVDPNYYGKDFFDTLSFPEKDERVNVELNTGERVIDLTVPEIPVNNGGVLTEPIIPENEEANMLSLISFNPFLPVTVHAANDTITINNAYKDSIVNLVDYYNKNNRLPSNVRNITGKWEPTSNSRRASDERVRLPGISAFSSARALLILIANDLYMLANNESNATTKEMLLSTSYYMMYSAFLYDYNTGSSVAVGSGLGEQFWKDYFNFINRHSEHWKAMTNNADDFFRKIKISDGTAVAHSKTMLSQLLNGLASSNASNSNKQLLFEAFADGLLSNATLPWKGSKAVAGTSEIIRWAYMVNTNSKRDTYISNIEKSLPTITIPTNVRDILIMGIEYKANKVFDFKADALAELGEAGSFLVAYMLPPTNYLTDLGYTEVRLNQGKAKMEENFPASVKEILREIANAIEAALKGIDNINDGVDKLKDGLSNIKLTLPNPIELVKNLLGGISDDPSDVAGSAIDVIDISSVNAEENADNITTINNFIPWWKNNNFKLRLNSRQQMLVLQSKTINEYIRQEVHAGMSDINSPVTEWLGIGLTVDMYRNPELARQVATYENKPIFRSSPNRINTLNNDAAINYLLLANIAKDTSIKFDTALDMDSPLFVDIYGNILTESGTVVIPFSANATLHRKANLMNVAFLESYGNKEFINVEYEKYDEPVPFIRKAFIVPEETIINNLRDYPAFATADLDDYTILIEDSDEKRLSINPIALDTSYGRVDLNNLDSASPAVQSTLYNISMSLYVNGVASDSFHINDSPTVTELISSNIIYQVARGQAYHRINYEKEKLLNEKLLDKGTIAQAVKFERLINSFKSTLQNSILTVPNLGYMEGIEYVIFFFYKIFIIVFIINLLAQIYLSAVKGKLSIFSVLKIGLSFVFLVIIVASLPFIFNYSYYAVNKKLLQDEALTVAALNEEKRNNGIELGIVNAVAPDLSTELYLKVTDVDVDIYNYLNEVIWSSEVNTMQQLYNKYMKFTPELNESDYVLKGKSAYYSVSDLFGSSEIYTDTKTNELKQVVTGNPAISFRMPYYAIVDYLLAQVNLYNQSISSYSYHIYSYGDGRLRSSGLISRYFYSNAFRLERNDVLYHADKLPRNIDSRLLSMAIFDRTGVFQFYDMTGWDSRSLFKEDAIERMRHSQWYADNITVEELLDCVDMLDKIAIDWVRNNEALVGRISDETFIKVLALKLSLEYNRLFNVPGPSAIEIHNLSTDDLIRLSIVPREVVFENSPYSYAKFILQEGGLIGVYLGAVLSLLLIAVSIIKPIATIIITISMILSLLVFRILLNRDIESVKGFVKFTVLLSLVNIAYSLMLKIGIILPGSVVINMRLLGLIILNTGFFMAYTWLVVVLFFNWSDLGNGAFNNVVKKRTLKIREISGEFIPKRHNDVENESVENGWDVYRDLKESDKYRKLYNSDDS